MRSIRSCGVTVLLRMEQPSGDGVTIYWTVSATVTDAPQNLQMNADI